MGPAAHVRVQHADRRCARVPGALEVALVGDQHGAPLAAPVDDLAQMLGGSTRPVGFDGELTYSSAGTRGPEAGQRVGGDALRAGQRRAHLVRRVGQRGDRRRGRPAPRPRWSGSDADQLLGADHGQHPVQAEPGDAEPAGQPVEAGLPGVLPADRDAGSPASPRRRAAPRWTTSGVGSTGVPTDRSTIPSGCARAVAAYDVSWSQGKSGSRAETAARGGLDARPTGGQWSWFCGGSASMSGWSLSITPILAAPPGEPRSSKKPTLAV